MSKYDINKINDDYDLMDDSEKLAIRYGALGRTLGDVVRDSAEKITSPNKVFDAWAKGDDLRTSGKSRSFLDDIEKRELDTLYSEATKKSSSAPNGISAEPIRDIWGNDLSKPKKPKDEPDSTNSQDSYDYNYYTNNKAVTFATQEKNAPKNLLQKENDYDIMYTGNAEDYSSPELFKASDVVSSSKADPSETYVTYGHTDKNVVGGIQSRLNELGYTDVDITGAFDAKTEAGIKKFQEKRGLPVTGVLDDATKTEMGFSEDYSVSRKGENATPWHAPYSPPFDMDAYRRKQERLKQEKEDALKAKEDEEEKESSFLSFWANVIAEFFYNHGGAQPFSQESDLIYDEYQKNIENDLNELSEQHGAQITHNYMWGIKSQNP